MGIRFDDLEDWYVEDKNVYAFPYDPKNYKIGDREWDKNWIIHRFNFC
jgi:hypothetical protein